MIVLGGFVGLEAVWILADIVNAPHGLAKLNRSSGAFSYCYQ